MSAIRGVHRPPANLLLVEDDEIDAEWALRALSGPSFNVEHVDSLKEALSRLASDNIQLVLLDLGLPDNTSDVGCIERIHSLNPDIPIIVYSGTAYESTGLLALEKGALYYFPKRLSDATLLARTVRHALERFQMQENLRRVIESSGDGMAIFSASDRQLQFANPAARKLLDIAAADHGYVFPYPLTSGQTKELTLPPQVSVELRVVDVDWNGRPALLATLRDISERRRIEHQLRQAQKMEAVGMLASGVAHDFNNILTIISGFTELLLDQVSPGSPMEEDLRQIKTAGERASSLIRRLLTFSRDIESEPRFMHLDQVVIDAHGMLQRLIGSDIELVLSTHTKERWIHADPGQIEQVVVNLVINARDAMPNGGTLSIETYGVYLDDNFDAGPLPKPKPGEYLALAVADTGIGMNEEIVEHIFEPFFSTKHKGQGTGLGLATTYGIVKRCRGSIHVLSESGQGTTIKIYLPCVDAPAALPGDEALSPIEVNGDETLLLVEDEDSVRRFTGQLLAARGYRVIEASTPAIAMEKAETHLADIDLVITDVIMPGMNGGEMARKLRAQRPDLPVIFISGYTADDVIRRGVGNSRMHFLQKPFTPRDLTGLVRQVLDAH